MARQVLILEGMLGQVAAHSTVQRTRRNKDQRVHTFVFRDLLRRRLEFSFTTTVDETYETRYAAGKSEQGTDTIMGRGRIWKHVGETSGGPRSAGKASAVLRAPDNRLWGTARVELVCGPTGPFGKQHATTLKIDL